MTPVAMRKLERQFNSSREVLRKILDDLQINPIVEYKVGKGMTTLYDPATIDGPKISAELEKIRKGHAGNGADTMQDVRAARLLDSVRRLEEKVDEILRLLRPFNPSQN